MMDRLQDAANILEDYRTRDSDESKKMLGTRVDPAVDAKLDTIAEEEDMPKSAIVRLLVRRFILQYALTDFDDDGLRHAVAVVMLEDVKDLYDGPAVADLVKQVIQAIEDGA